MGILGSNILIASDFADRLAPFAPDVSEVIAGLNQAAWAAFDSELLDLCRLRIAVLQGDDFDGGLPAHPIAVNPQKREAVKEWPDSPLFSARERACLAFTEQFVGDVAGITKADTDVVLEYLTPEDFYTFVMALLVIDQHQRLALGLRRMLGPEEETA